MTFELRSIEPIAKGISRSIVRDIKRAVRDLDALTAEGTIHDIRKRIKRMRALVRLVRQDIGPKNCDHIDGRLQKCGKQLADLRDAEVLLKTVDDLKSNNIFRFGAKSFQRLHEQLASRHDDGLADFLGCRQRIGFIKKRLRKTRKDIQNWKLGSGWSLIRDGIKTTYDQSKNCLIAAIADPSTENLHSWRKEVKCLWHQIQFIRPLHARRISPFEKRLHDLATAIGNDHDLAILTQTIVDNEGGPSEFVMEFAATIQKKRLKLQASAFRLGRKFFQQPGDRFDRQLRTGQPTGRSDN